MQRRGGQFSKYLGAACLLAILVCYGAPSLLGAAGRVRAALRLPAAADPAAGLQFDGIDDRVTFGPAPALGAATFTIETWFRRDGPGSTATTGGGGVVAVPLVTKGMSEAEGDNRDTNYFLGIDGKRRVLAADFEDTVNGGNHPVLGVTPICDGVWYHAAATYDGTTWRLYLNGALETQLVVGSFTPRFDSIQQAAFATAMNSTGSAGGAFFGALDEPRIWNVVRTASEIQATMTQPLLGAPGLIGRWGLDEGTGLQALDSTGNGNTGTLRNGTAWSGSSPFATTPMPTGSYGLRLKGTAAAADYVSFGNPAALGTPTFTVETWFKQDGAGVTTTTGTGGLTAVVPLVTKGRNDGDGTTQDINYFLGLSGNMLAADFEEGASGLVPGLNHPLIGSTVIQNNVWYHAAVTYDGVTMQLYLNGVLDGLSVVARPARADSTEQAAIGSALTASGVAAGFFAGSVDEVRVWNRARTAAEVASGRDREISAASGLIGRWSFNDCCGQPRDSSPSAAGGTLFGTSWQWVTGGPLSAGANAAPVVSAGPDQTITLPALALLSGTVTDDARTGTPVTYGWTIVSGPGGVTFGNVAGLASTVGATVAGTYVLALTANDGELSATDQIAVTVLSASAPNQAPAVNAGPDQTIQFPAAAVLAGSVSDDGQPGGDPTTTWSKVSGPGTVTFAQPSEVATTATFSAPGTYVLMLSGSDGGLSSSDTVTIVVNSVSANTAIAFNGSTYVTFGQAPGLGAGTFTLEAWFKRTGAGTTTTTGTGGVTAVPLVTKGRSENDGSTVDMNYFLGIRSDNVLVADFEEGASGASPGLNHPVAGATAIQNNVWYHAAATYDGIKWQLFLNGVLERELAVNRPPRADSIQHAAIASALSSTGAASGFFTGVVDEARIWSAARTQQQIVDGMSTEIASAPGLLGRWGLNETSGTVVADSTGHGINGTITGGALSSVPGAPFNIVVNNAPDAPVIQTPANGGSTAPPATTLGVAVNDADGDPLTVTYYGRPKATTAPDFTYLTIPDTQHYVDNTTFPATFTTQTNWIVANRGPMNIAFVSHLGDIAEHIDQVELEWQRADTSMTVLDVNGIPYGVSPGNHDQSAAGVANFYDQYFGITRFLGRPWYGGYLGAEVDDPVNRLNKNNYELFSVGGLDFLVIHIEHDWPTYAVTWADKIIKRYPNRRVILSTHLFLNTSNARPTSAQFRADGTSAEAVWQQIVKPNCNVFMVVNGHYPGEGRRTDLNNCGQPVHQVLMDYQSRANGGDGWLRYFAFKPSENKIYAYTYSPTRGEFETDDSSQFVLDYNMQGTPYSVIATNGSVTPGSTTTATWSGLTAGTQYEWYVTVNDGKATTTGPVWGFTASSTTNTPPVAAADAYSLSEDGTLSIVAPGVLGNDTDADDDQLSTAVGQGPSHGTLSLLSNGGFVYTPAANFNGLDSFTYTVGDGHSQSAPATVTLTIAAVNDAPIATSDTATTPEDTAVGIAVLVNDTDGDGDTLTVVSVGVPAHGTAIVNGAGVITYTPQANYSGSDTFTYVVQDGHSGSATGTVTVTVTAANDAPIATNDTATTAEDTPVIVGVLANDQDGDGDVLSVLSVSPPAHGSAVIGANGTITYTPAANYSGPDSFTYTVSDGHGGTAVGTVTVTVGAVNDAPSATDDAATTAEDTPVSIAVLANDTDLDSDTLSVSGVGAPGHGSATVNADGTISYTPAANYSGSDSFSYTVSDGHGGTAVGTVTMTVSAVNDAPAATNDAATTAEDTPVSIAVLANDTDLDADTLVVTGVSAPGHGTAMANADRTISYTPAANYAGPDSFTYTVSDGHGGTGVGTVTVTVSAVNDAPAAIDDAATTAEDTPVSVAVLANDTDLDGDTLSVTGVGAAGHGTATANGNGTISYTPAPNYSGPDSFTYTVSDGHGGTAVGTVTVSVSAVNDAPAATDDAATTAEDTAVSIAVLANDTDLDGDTLSVAGVGAAGHGTPTANADGSVTYTPATNYSGPDTFTYTVSDGHGGSAVGSVTVSVSAVNDAPAATDDAATTAEDMAVSITVLANDTDLDGDTLVVTGVGAAGHGTATANADGTISYTPAANYSGPDSFTYTVSDGHGGTAVGSVTVSVSAVNDAPAATDDAATTTEDTAVSIAVLANDTDLDGDTLSVSGVGAAGHGTATANADGTITYTPAANYSGPDSFTYTVTDGHGVTAVGTVAITVNAVNDAPTASDDAATTAEDTPVSVAVLANDTDLDGDTLVVTGVGAAGHGTATANADGTISYTPAANYSGPDSFTYTVSDGHGGTAVGSVTVSVSAVNDAPAATDDAATTAEDTPVSIAVLANDTDLDSDTLSVSGVGAAAHGTATANADGTISYTPAANYSGPDSFSYTVSDGHGGTAVGTVTVSVSAVNDAPAATDDAATTTEDTAVSIAVLANDTDLDGDTLSVSGVGAAGHGTATANGNGTISYTPAPNYSGPDSFTYTVSDGHGGTAVGAVTVSVSAVNDAPAATDDAATTAEDTPVSVAVLANDTDLDGDGLVVSGVTVPAHGSATVNADGSVTYTPAANYSGPDSFTYTVSDGHGGTAVGTVTVSVSAVNDAPAAIDDAATTAEDTAVSIAVLANDTDLDGDTLNVSGVGGAAHGAATVNADGSVTYTPAANYSGPDSFTYTVSDGHGGTAVGSVTVSVSAVNDAPAATDDAATTAEDTAVSIAVLGNDTDLDGDTLSVSGVGAAGHGTATANADGSVTYTPAANYSGADSFTYTVSDGHGGTAVGSVTVSVSAVNDAPTATDDAATTTEDTAVTITVLANDTDLDSDTLSVSGVGAAGHGTATANADGTIRYTPAANYSGADSFTYTVSDGHGGTAVGTVTVSVSAVNDAPAAADDAATTAEDTPVSVAVLANDTDLDSDTLSVSGVGAAGHGTATANADGTISYAPAANYSGVDSFTYTVSDGHGGTAVGTVTVSVSAVNDAPAAIDDAATTAEDTAVSIAVLANDTDLDGDTLNVSGVGGAAHGAATVNADGSVTYTPAANYSGPDSFTYTVSDGHGGTAVGSVTVSVSAVNDAPAATDDAATTAEDTAVSIAVLGNDTDLDGDTLSVSGVGAAGHGTATANADGSVTYTPAANYSGPDSFTYTVSDGHGGTAVGSVTVSVSAVNDAPAATDDAATTAEDTAVSIAVLANDTDLDGDTLNVSGVGGAAHGAATVNADGSVTYTPAANYSGPDSFTYTVSDGHGGTAVGSVTVSVSAVNDAPAATDDAATTAEDTAVSIAVLGNDTDLDGDTLSVSGVGAAGHGTATANADGSVTYTPAANYSGPDSFTYTVSDGHGGTAVGSVTVSVSAVNDAPAATDDAATTAEDTAVSIAVLGNDTDLDSDTLSVSGVGAAGHGTATANADGTIRYTPAPNYSGADSFTYTVSDGHGGTAVGTVTVSVSAVNDAPAATDDAATTTEDTPVSVAVLANDTDLDGDTLSVSGVGAAGHGTATANADGSVTYTPAANYSGADSFTYTVSDGHGGTAVGSVTVSVSAVNDAPTATDDAATTTEDTAVTITVLANDTDLDGDTLSVSGVGAAGHGTATANADGTIRYTPAANYSGADSFTYTVSDGHGGTAVGTVTVSVSAVNDAPATADDAATTAEDTPVSVAVLANDTDLDSDTLSVSGVGAAGHGTATANADGSVTYTPAANYSGADSFTYTVSDGHGGTAVGTVTVSVSAVNDAPAATDDAATTTEDTAVSIAVLANDTDLDGDTLSVSGVGAAGHGTATANADGSVTYTPAANYSGPDTFTYTVSDGHGGTAVGSVTVSVSAVNDAPAATDDAATTTEDTAVSIAVLANDTDLDSDTLSVSGVGAAGHGTATANADGTIRYTPAPNYSGADSFTYTVSDGHGGTAIGTVMVTVSAVNDAPTATDDVSTTTEDTPISIAVLGNDTDLDGDTLSVSGVGAAGHGTATANADGSVTYTPAANYSGADSFTYTVSDGHGGTAIGTVTVSVSAVNDAPAAADDAATTTEDMAVSITVLANDSDLDGDTLVVTGVGAAGHGIATANADGTISYTPAANYSGPDTFTYTVSDGHGGTAVGTVTVSVSAVNDAPAATDDAATTAEDTAVSIAVLANDTDLDGDTLSVSGVGAAGHGTATANADGSVTYTPAANYSGPDTFTYTVSDGHGGTAVGTVTVSVSAVNDAPTATDDAATTTEDASVSIAVLANDTDLDGDTLSVSGVGAAGHGTATANADGTITYTPAANYSGADSFTYTVSDGHGGTAVGTVTVSVSAVNDAPAATDDAATTAEDTAVSIAVLANDSDLDGDTLVVTGVGAAGHGTATANADGSVTYTSAANYSGPDSFTYTVSDGHGGAATGTVTVTVSAVNDAPMATDDAATTAEDTPVSIAVLANDADLDSDTLSVSGVGAAGHGTATANADGTISYTPAPNYSGPDSFTYTVSDGHGGTATGTVTVTVSAVNDAPAATDDAATTAEDTPVSLAVLANDTDLDSDTLVVSGVGPAGHGLSTANADGTISYTPAANYSGPDSFTYTVSDGHGGAATGTVTVTVSAVNDAPMATDDAATTTEDASVSIAVLANDTDLDSDTLSVSGVGAAGHGTATANADGTISYTPAPNYSGPDSFTYTVSDGHGGTATGTVTVTVSAVNDAPAATDDAATTAEDTPVSLAVLANDTDLDSDTLVVSGVGPAGHGLSTANADGTIGYTPGANYSGPDSFTYTVSDGHGGTATGTVTVTVSAVNDAPAAIDDAATTLEDTPVGIAVLANDSDLEGDTLSVSGVGAAGHGTATANADGTITYTPAANYSGPDSFTYTVSDGHGGSATGTVTVTVNSVNDAPTATDDAATTAEDTPVSLAVLANDIDLDADTLVVSGVSAAGHGTATANADGSVTYTPAANYSGPDSFTYTVSDGHGGTATGTVTVTVSTVNDAPSATDDAAATAEDAPVSVAVLVNDTDLDGDSLVVGSVSAAGHGTATANADGTITYTPAANYSGLDSFTYTVSDGHGGSATGTVTVTVNSVNDAPAAADDAATAVEDTSVSIAVLANDIDLDGDTLVVSGVSVPAHGTATANADGTITYVPAANYSGPDSFTYTISDAHGGTASGTVTMTVSAVNDAPAATDDIATTAEDAPVSIAVLANDTDLDGDSLVVSGVSVPGHGTATANADGSVTYAPAPNYSGPDSFTYTVSDGHGGTAIGTVTVSVSAVNDAPAAADDAATAVEDTPVSIAVLANDIDLDGDTLVVSGVSVPAHGTATANADGTITYAPAANYSGPDSFTYTVSDGHDGTVSGTVAVTVSAVNDPPAAGDDATTTAEDTAVSVTVLANDTDLDGDTVSVSSVTAAAHGNAVINPDGTIVYTPAANYHGADSFGYTVGDGHGGTATATVTVTVAGVNDSPIAVNDSVTTAEDTAASVTVLANDTDLDGDLVSVSAVTAPAHGNAVINPNGTITYTPAANYHGADSFSYSIGDGNGGLASATVSVTVTPANDVPVPADDAATTAEDTPVTIAVLANDVDPDGDPLSVAGVLGAMPSIAATAGSWSHGASVTIAGSGFGVKPTAAPTVWDDASGNRPSDKWDGAWPNCGANSDYNLAYRTPAEVGRNIALPHTHTSRYIAGAHFGPVPDADCGYSVMMWKVRTVASFPAYSYASWYQRADDNWQFGGDDNFKAFAYSLGTGPYSLPDNWYIEYNGAPTSPTSTAQWHLNDDGRSLVDPDENGHNWWWGQAINPMAGAWTKIEMETKYTNLDDGYIKLWENGVLQVNYHGKTDGLAGTTRTEGIGGYARNYSNSSNWRYFADVYLDASRARVILGNAPTLSASTVREVQVPTAWSDSAITVSVNLGSFADGAEVYLYVVGVNGEVNAAGVPVSGSAAPGAGTATPGSASVNADGTITYTPAPNYSGPASFAYTVDDGHGGAATATVHVTVTPANDGPVAGNDAAAAVEDASVSIAVLANDTDLEGDSLAVTGVSAPANGIATANADGTITYTPAANYSGPDSFTYTVTDGHGGTATGTVTVTVSAVNDAPAAADDAATTAEDTRLSIAVLGNDTDLDGDTLTVSGVGAAGHGTATANADGTITYTPTGNYSGPDSFTYTVGDGHGGTATGTVTVTVTAANDAPAAADDAATTAEDTPVSIAVLGNDSDLDGDTLTVSGLTIPGHGAAVINADGTVTYTPADNYSGPDSFTYTVSDGHGGTANGTVVVTVSAVNDAPAATDDGATTAEDTPVSLAVLANDTDLDGDALVVSGVSMPAHGAATANADGTISYTPAANYSGPDSFTYTVSDGHGGSASGTVTVTVSAVNDAPTATDDAATTAEDTPIGIAVLANDTDLESDTLTVSGVGAAGHGTAAMNADGSVTYTPAANYSGPDSFTYTVSDGHGGAAVGTVTVTVTAANDAPAATDDAVTTAEDTPVGIAVLANDTDLDGDSLVATGVGVPAHGTAAANADGTVTYAPAANYSGPDSFTYTVSDGHGGTAVGTVTVTVTAANDAPAAADDAATTAEDAPVSIAVLANDTDLDGDPLTVSGVGAAGHGTAAVNADGSVTYTPAANYYGPDSFTYTVSDGHGSTASGTVTMTVTAANDAPSATGDAATTAEDTAVSIAALANDSDVDGDTVGLVSVSSPAHGTATINPDGTITYAPAADYNGTDTFSYVAGDGHGGEATATVTIAITAVPDAPMAQADTYSTNEDLPLNANGAGVLGNDSDPDGGQLTAVLVASPAHGTLSFAANGHFTYVPAPDASGVETFSYKVSNGSVESGIVVVTIHVLPVNDAPSAEAQSVIARFQTPTPIVLHGQDVEGDTLTFRVVASPSHGTLSGTAPDLVYTPESGFAGADTFSFVANDGLADSSAVSVTLQVRAVSRPPEAEDQWMLLDEDTSVEITLNAGDPDGDPLTFTIVSPPQHGTLSGSGTTLIYTPAPDYSGDDRFTFRVSDGMSDSNDASVDLWIWSVNDPPVVQDVTFAVDPGGSIDGQLQATDQEEDWVFFWLLSEPSNGTVTLDPMSGTFTYAANPGSSGYDSISYTVYDWQSQGTVATIYFVPASLPEGGAPPSPPPPPPVPQAPPSDRNR